MADTAEPQKPRASFEGVTLVQLTHIAAARAEGFALREILDAEGLDERVFGAAELACKAKLSDPEVGPKLFERYELELSRAEERLCRRVRPLDEDLEGWTRFLAAYGASQAPLAMLETLGLKLPDLSRLARTWKRRLEADRDLAWKAEKLVKDQDPRAGPPAVRVEPPKLVPSPDARPKPKEAPPVAPPPVRKSRPEVRVPPAISGTALALDVPRGPALPFVEGPDEEPAPPPRIRVDLPPREALSGTSLALDVPRGKALPFGETDPGPEKPTVVRAPIELAGTSLSLDIPRGPALPFAETDEPAIEEAKHPAPDVNLPPREALSGTSLSLDIPRGPSLPFVGTDPPEEKPTPPRVPIDLAGTSLALDIPRGPALPFVKPSAPAPATATASATASVSASAPVSVSVSASAPKLSLTEHAALTVELVMAQARAAEVLARYRITQAEREALDKHYQAIVAADERQRAAWHEAYKAHYARIASSFSRR